ncbi:MAG: flavodoxin-dependent (E)-4-hydroxy-3-methylbut-2-enyl-diphosphate synthase, partial [Clostridia bacterium]|nr:flavodoxin-dependent (E)-4-hydroxy-3-methylbut-2-enyl-diphosphate synthase [Clostridia bacterium]
AKDLLKAIGLRKKGINIVSCPTCGRTKIDLIGLAKEAEKRLSNIDKDLTVAIMGCVVNGPGEASAADIGVAGGDGCGVLFKKDGTKIKISEDKILDVLIEEINKM